MFEQQRMFSSIEVHNILDRVKLWIEIKLRHCSILDIEQCFVYKNILPCLETYLHATLFFKQIHKKCAAILFFMIFVFNLYKIISTWLEKNKHLKLLWNSLCLFFHDWFTIYVWMKCFIRHMFYRLPLC